MIGAISLHFSCISGPEMHEKRQGNCTNRRTLLHKFWERSQNLCNKVRRLVQFPCICSAFQALKCTKMQGNCTNRRTLLHKFWERSQNFCNKVRRLVEFRCIFRAFQGLKRTKNARKLHQSSYFVT